MPCGSNSLSISTGHVLMAIMEEKKRARPILQVFFKSLLTSYEPISYRHVMCGDAQNQSERALQCYLARDIDIVKGKTETSISINLPQN